MPRAIREKINGNAPKRSDRTFKNLIYQKKSDYACLETNVIKFLTFKTLTSEKRYLCIFEDQNWQDSRFFSLDALLFLRIRYWLTYVVRLLDNMIELI